MIEIEQLTKRYGHSGISDVTFSCAPGTVTGFLGPNGAGKSTTMKILCGLVPPDSGRATVNGQHYVDLADPGRTVGVLLDASAQHVGRTGREILTLTARVLDVSNQRVEQLLRAVGLEGEYAERRVGKYSLGMRQRLALANALIGDPGVLILDEPANGLDPEGIHWMRTLLREFADRGGTVLLSSHLLTEVQAVADHLVIIGRGKVVANGSVDELLSHNGTFVRTLDPQQLCKVFDERHVAWHRDAEGAFRVDAPPETVGRAANAASATLIELRSADQDGLEDLFLSLTSNNSDENIEQMEVSA
jgi:ABC-2 type transport system ATP-binding protein